MANSGTSKGVKAALRWLAGLAAFAGLSAGAPAAAETQAAPAVAPAAAPAPDAEPSAEDENIAAAVDFARRLTADATVALTKEGANEAEKLAAFQVVLKDGLALDVIAKFMLGDARKSMSDAQIARYDAIFPDYITKLYADQFADIVGKPLEVIDQKSLGARDVIVRTQFPRADAAPINVDWRIRKLRTGEQKAIDIIVSGVSIMLVKREEFSAFIGQNGVDKLLDRLEAEAAA